MFSSMFYTAIAMGRSVLSAFGVALSALEMERTSEEDAPVLVHRVDVNPQMLRWG